MVVLANNERCEIAEGATALDLSVSVGLDGNVIAAKVNGVLTDLSTKLQDNDVVLLITYSDPEGLAILRHSTAHVLAKAILEIDPDAKLAIGPAIENGFYYDIQSKRMFVAEDLVEIEDKMRDIINRKLDFEKLHMKKEEAVALFQARYQDFKVELANDIQDEGVSIYKLGDSLDLCRGPHLPNTSYIPDDAFKLTSLAGAYWRGDSTKAVLQRIYGTAFRNSREMSAYFTLLEEAQARDHRKLGQELELFHIDEYAPGHVFWLKNGLVLFNLIKNKIEKIALKYGYFFVQTPQLLDKALWETSGHWEKFKENMYIVHDDDSTMAIKPMNCPGHIIVYKTGAVKSYRDLPIRMAEFGLCHRNEPSGALHGLMRLRAFMQDDGHIFCSPDQIVSETQKFCQSLQELYADFGFSDIKVKFSDRPGKRAGNNDVWDIAEKSLAEAAEASGLTYTVNKGEGAFYGPKLEFILRDCLGREWQCGTLQVDFVLPERFDISYVDQNGQKRAPVMLHRAVIGSLERFTGILIEHHAGKLPFWLAPVQIAVISITDASAEYAQSIHKMLIEAGFRAILDTNNEKITYKVRAHSVNKVPRMIIVGNQEKDNHTISIRSLGTNESEIIDIDNILLYFTTLSMV
ncbi:MAG: threonine--tRNA ligase [Holosporales bacterium]|nr:threonine--tRNA ligase [Holosporales bacterium]